MLTNRKEEQVSDSKKCLEEAFAGESQANRRYLAYAEKADREGYAQAARLFRAAAAAETVHAHNHLRAMNAVGSTRENLKDAIAGETHEFKSMYPEMIETAEEEEDTRALRSFRYANEVEKIHARLYSEMSESLELKREEEGYPYFVCPVCGHTAEREAPETCPVCGTAGDRYTRID
jgi:rubrerythrin